MVKTVSSWQDPDCYCEWTVKYSLSRENRDSICTGVHAWGSCTHVRRRILTYRRPNDFRTMDRGRRLAQMCMEVPVEITDLKSIQRTERCTWPWAHWCQSPKERSLESGVFPAVIRSRRKLASRHYRNVECDHISARVSSSFSSSLFLLYLLLLPIIIIVVYLFVAAVGLPHNYRASLTVFILN